jgi:hypothetical protein
MSLITISKRFLWLSTGLGSDLFSKVSQVAQNLYVGVGSCILITAVVAAFALAYLLSLLTDSSLLIALIAVLFGILVYFLDRTLFLTNHLTSSSLLRRALTASISVLFAAMVTVVILVPLELKLFSQQIRPKLNVIAKINSAVDEEISQRKADVEKRTVDIRRRENTISQLYDDAYNEAAGKGTSRKPGRGPYFESKLRSAEEEKERATKLNDIDRDAISQHIKAIQELEMFKEQGANSLGTFLKMQDYSPNAQARALREVARFLQWRNENLRERNDLDSLLNDVADNYRNDLFAELVTLRDIISGNTTASVIHWALTALLMLLNVIPTLLPILAARAAPDQGAYTLDTDVLDVNERLEIAFSRALDKSALSPRS